VPGRVTGSRTAREHTKEEPKMKSHCPVCASPELRPTYVARPTYLICENCEARFRPSAALVTYTAALAFASDQLACTCDDARGCPQCFQRADDLLGATVRDSQGRTWEVTGVGEKDGFPTISGDLYWDRPGEVEVLAPATREMDPAR
jgi:hypothetical protein